MARPPRKSGQRVSLTPATMQRIAKSVLAFEKGDRDMSGISLRTGGSECDVVRGTFTGSWAKGALATVTDSTLSAVTYDAINYFTSITGTGTKDCMLAFVGGEWVLLQFDLRQLDGYSSSKTQVLGSVNGSLKWIDTTPCT